MFLTELNKARPKSEHLEPSRLADKSSQPSTSHSMGNLLNVPKQGYQERLVDWDLDHMQPGATNHQVTQSQYQNFYQNPPPPSYSSFHSSQNLLQIPRTMSNLVNSSANSSNLPPTIYPINELPTNEDYHCCHSKNYWTKRQIPIIQEPNQMFLTIPSHGEPYPPYPVRVPRNYGYYTDDKTELIFPTRNSSEDSVDSLDDERDEEEESIPYIDDDKSEGSQLDDFCSDCSNFKKESKETKIEKENPVDEDDNDDDVFKDEILVISTPKMHTIMPELNLDLSGLNSDISSEDSNPEKCWKSPEEVRLGCGRVAALAKHFSKLGESGLIKLKSMKLNGSRQFMSEPDVALHDQVEKRSKKEFKSESDLSKIDGKNSTNTPEREWSMILLDIQFNDQEKEDKTTEIDLEKSSKVMEKNESKLSLEEQENIIEQLKEFSNLDNVDAPLFIPKEKSKSSNSNSNSNSDKETMTDSNDSSTTNIPKYKIVGTMRLENFRQHSLPSVLGGLNISPKMPKKINKLEKYWSLKDLMFDDKDSNPTVNDSPKYFIFPTCSRVVSAPEITNEDVNFFQFHSISEGENLNIQSTLSLNGDTVNTDIKTETFGKERKVNFQIESKTKFPNSFLRTRNLSKSHEELGRRNKNLIRSKIICKSLEKIPNLTMKEKRSFFQQPKKEKCSFIGTHAAIKSVLENYNQRNENSDYGDSRKKFVKEKANSDLDVSERMPTPRFERGDWIFREFPPLDNNPEIRKLVD